MSNQAVHQTEGKIQQVEFRAMGSQIMAAVESSDSEAISALDEVQGWFEEWEQTLSRFRESSELSLLNQSAGSASPVPVSETLWKVLQLALQAAAYTGGLVTPTVLKSLEAAGYSTNFDDMKGESADSGIKRSTRTSSVIADWRRIRMYPETRSVKLPRGARLDLGGVGKGWAADEAVSRLAQYGPAIVNAGGDIALSGPRLDGSDWFVGIEAPIAPGFADGEQLDLLSMKSGGIATSGRDYRRWQQDGKWRHHIIDPRTGSPAETDVLAVTVAAPTACVAEIGVKVAFLMGSVEGVAWLDERPSLAGLLILEDGQVVKSKNLGDYLWSSKSGQ